MKKIASLLITLFAVGFIFAQSNTPRTGIGAGNDNTFRAMTIKYVPVSDATGNDTIKLNLNGYKTLIPVTLKDSVNFNFTPVTRCYLGDQVQFLVTKSSGAGKIKFVGSNFDVSADTTYGGSTIAISSSKKANVVFTFDGAKWVETSRITQ